MPGVTVHPTAVIDDGALVDETASVWHFAHVCSGASIGERSSLGQNVYVGPGVRIGRNVRVQNNVSVYEGVELEDDVFVGPSAVFTNVRNPRSAHPTHTYRHTSVRRGATLGANCTVVAPVVIGEWAFIGAGAVVTKDVEPHALMHGVPARAVGWACRCGQALTDYHVATQEPCEGCGRTWRLETPGLVEVLRARA